MTFEGTNSVTGCSVFKHSGIGPASSRFALPLIGGVMALASAYGAAESDLQSAAQTAWRPASNIGAGTSRAAMAKTNNYQPKTTLGRRLLALRNEAIAGGMPLVPTKRIIEELEAIRG